MHVGLLALELGADDVTYIPSSTRHAHLMHNHRLLSLLCAAS